MGDNKDRYYVSKLIKSFYNFTVNSSPTQCCSIIILKCCSDYALYSKLVNFSLNRGD